MRKSLFFPIFDLKKRLKFEDIQKYEISHNEYFKIGIFSLKSIVKDKSDCVHRVLAKNMKRQKLHLQIDIKCGNLMRSINHSTSGSKIEARDYFCDQIFAIL